MGDAFRLGKWYEAQSQVRAHFGEYRKGTAIPTTTQKIAYLTPRPPLLEGEGESAPRFSSGWVLDWA